MIEIKEFRIMKDQNIQKRRLQAVEAIFQTAEFKDLTIFRQYVRDKVSEPHGQMSVCWDTQALHEGRLQHMTTPEKRSIEEMIDNKAKLLSLVRSEVTARRRAVVAMKWHASANIEWDATPPISNGISIRQEQHGGQSKGKA